MKENFKESLALILKHEGGYVDHPADPGGATMKGITLATFSHFKKKSMTKDELRAISDADVENIYKVGYWDAMRCDELPAGVDLLAFDMAVNKGVSRAARLLQQAAGVRDDGVLGPRSMEAIGKMPVKELIAKVSEGRRDFYRGLKTFSVFGRGWLRRVDETEKEALHAA
ncbi:zliS Lysozyme family protein [uncultured Caudovirales phage]|uniref:ZliS Lysozyme family protein n=1 Tax=uncultured Caudovirales phage TaxID=2100421 RepID=A0A6J7X5M7_9CAUD|nr:zliS Lysozyme family protein [uncultured Caudovirales phage]